MPPFDGCRPSEKLGFDAVLIGGMLAPTVAPPREVDCSPVRRSPGSGLGGFPPSIGAGDPTIPPLILIRLVFILHTYHP